MLVSAFPLAAQHEWATYYEDSSLSIKYLYRDCYDVANGINMQKILLSYTNKTQQSIEVTFQRKFAYNNTPASEPTDENTFILTLKPGEVLEGSCDLKDKRFYFFVKMLDGTSQSVLSSFEIVNIKVAPKP